MRERGWWWWCVQFFSWWTTRQQETFQTSSYIQGTQLYNIFYTSQKSYSTICLKLIDKLIDESTQVPFITKICIFLEMDDYV